METKTETQEYWMKDLEVITENTKDKWSWEYRGCNGFMGDFEDFVERQVKEIRNVVKEKNGSVSDEVNEVLDTYEMEHKETYKELEVLYKDVNDYENDIGKRIVEVKNNIIELEEN